MSTLYRFLFCVLILHEFLFYVMIFISISILRSNLYINRMLKYAKSAFTSMRAKTEKRVFSRFNLRNLMKSEMFKNFWRYLSRSRKESNALNPWSYFKMCQSDEILSVICWFERMILDSRLLNSALSMTFRICYLVRTNDRKSSIWSICWSLFACLSRHWARLVHQRSTLCSRSTIDYSSILKKHLIVSLANVFSEKKAYLKLLKRLESN